MSKEENKSAKVPRRRAEDKLEDQCREPRSNKEFLQHQLLKLKVPGTVSLLKEIVHELEQQENKLELQNEALQQARADLKLLLEQYSDLYDSAPIGYLNLDRIGYVLKVNSAAARLLGMERTELLNKHLHRFMEQVSPTEFNDFMGKIYNSGTQVSLEFEQRRMGEKFIFHIEGRECIHGEEIIAALIDITLEREAELLRVEEQRLRIIFENVTNGILLCGPDGKVIAGNPAAKAILSLTAKEMHKMSLVEIFLKATHEDGTAFSGDTKTFMKSLQDDESVIVGCEPRSTYYTWIEVSALAVAQPSKDKAQVLICFNDITSQKCLTLYNTLTLREKEIFKLIVKGYGRQVIAENLDISPKTVDKHRGNLAEKLNMYERVELVDFSKQMSGR